jgi:hypothetical protein
VVYPKPPSLVSSQEITRSGVVLYKNKPPDLLASCSKAPVWCRGEMPASGNVEKKGKKGWNEFVE